MQGSWSKWSLGTVLVLGCVLSAYAVPKDGVLGNLLAFEGNVRGFVRAVCLLTGFGLLAGSILRYQNYRQGHFGTKISQVIWMAIFGLTMVGITYIPMFQIK